MAEERFNTAVKRFETANTGVFWDADGCKKPVGLNAVVVSQNIRSALKRLNYHGEVSIFAYGESNKILDGLESDPNELPINIFKQTSNTFDYRGDEYGRLQRILTDFMCWQVDNPVPANVMLVLGDDISSRDEFVCALNHLSSSHYNMHFAYPQGAAEPKNFPVHTKWLWESLSVRGTLIKYEDKRT
ncbi:hypothetical protein EUTSA_v10022152mg, partial [Eutrema salsugineum]